MSCESKAGQADARPLTNFRNSKARRDEATRFDVCYLITGYLCAFVIRESGCGDRDQLHHLVDIFLHALKFSACKI
jgi:hypothetical protein